MRKILLPILFLSTFLAFALHRPAQPEPPRNDVPDSDRVVKTDAQWKQELDPEVYRITRMQCTEPAFTGKFWNHKEKGTYLCSNCRLPLFSSGRKFDSGTGWPSFTAPVNADNVRELPDSSHGMVRTEIRCARCDAHLGHVFNDGPRPAGIRHCVNSASLLFEPER